MIQIFTSMPFSKGVMRYKTWLERKKLKSICVQFWTKGQKTPKRTEKKISTFFSETLFFQKSGRATFSSLWCFIFMQKSEKTNKQSLIYSKTTRPKRKG